MGPIWARDATHETISNPELPSAAGPPRISACRQEVRCAVRFPLVLPVVLSTGDDRDCRAYAQCLGQRRAV